MVKNGSSYLRKYLMNSDEIIYVFNPSISVFYWKKIDEGKHHNITLFHVAKENIQYHFLS